jgi:heme-degrading monooxygenase HmoA
MTANSRLLKEEIFVGIQNRRIPGFKSIQLLRRKIGDEVEFVTIMVFDSLDAVCDFGEDYEAAVVPEKTEQSCLI